MSLRLRRGKGMGGEESRRSAEGGMTMVFWEIGVVSCFGVLTFELPSRCVLTASAKSSGYSLLSDEKLSRYMGDGTKPLLYKDCARLVRFHRGERGLIGLCIEERGLLEP